MLPIKPVVGWHQIKHRNCYFQSVQIETTVKTSKGTHTIYPHINSYYFRSYYSLVGIYDHITNEFYELPRAHYSRTTAKQITQFINSLCSMMHGYRFTHYPTVARVKDCEGYRLKDWNGYSKGYPLEF